MTHKNEMPIDMDLGAVALQIIFKGDRCVEDAGDAFVRAYLFRILVMFEWCRVDASMRNQLMPPIRSNLIEISEWPEDFFREKEMEFLEDMRQRFRL